MWQDQGRHSSTGRARRCQRRDASSRLAGCPMGFRRLNGEDSGLSSRECRFNSGREHQRIVIPAQAGIQCLRTSLDSRLRGNDGATHLAVAQRQARLVRDEEAAGSNPAGETNTPPVAQWMSETLRTSRSRVRILPGVPFSNDAVTQRPECSPVEREAAGSNPAGVATLHGA